MMLFSDRGTPKAIQNTNGYSGHTYKLTKSDGSFNYIKIHFKSNQGNDCLVDSEATELSGSDPDNHTASLRNAIETGNFPSWTMCFQVMSPKQAERYKWNIFDMTKVWPHADFPLLPVAKLTLNQNVSKYHPFEKCYSNNLSRETTLLISNKPRFHPLTWCEALHHLLIPVCKPYNISNQS
jgi:catalase